MKKMNRTELLRYISETVLTYEKMEVTSHILWDYMCDSQKLLDWLTIGSNTEQFYIAIRKSGLASGTKEQVNELTKILGQSIHTIEICKTQEYFPEYDFEVKEY